METYPKIILMASHIEIAHFLLRKHVRKGDMVIDATCGNGHDSLLLADLALTPRSGSLHCYDIQEVAVRATKERLKNHPCLKRVAFHHTSHTELPEGSPSVVVYNLGYFPGGDTSLTTLTETSFSSFNTALSRLKPGGALFITFYPGHPEGARELETGQSWAKEVRSQGFKLFVYKQLYADSVPQLWVIKKPFPKK